MRTRAPYLSGDPAIEGFAAMLKVIAHRSEPAEESATLLQEAMRRGWIDAGGQPTAAACIVLHDLIDRKTVADHRPTGALSSRAVRGTAPEAFETAPTTRICSSEDGATQLSASANGTVCAPAEIARTDRAAERVRVSDLGLPLRERGALDLRRDGSQHRRYAWLYDDLLS